MPGSVEIVAPPEGQHALAVLEAPPNPVVLHHQGVAAFATITVYGKGQASGQRKCAAAMVAMTQVKRLQAQLQTDLEEVMKSCNQRIKERWLKICVCEDT